MIFNPYRVSTATVHIIYTLCCLSVLKYLYIPKLFILTPSHFAVQEKECTQKAGANWGKNL